jgi:hypothetical protein
MQRSGKMGALGGTQKKNTFLSRARYQIMKLLLYLIQQSLCTKLSHHVGLIFVVRYPKNAYFECRLEML